MWSLIRGTTVDLFRHDHFTLWMPDQIDFLYYNKALVYTQPSIVLLPGIHHLVLQCISFRFTDLGGHILIPY